ncbi:MAG: transketolase family protein [Clostridia bacterium]|nr:transketolase family protein [Clostridia bacterium]
MALSTREAYGEALRKLGAKYDFWVMDADLSKATKTDLFADAYPERFINMGIAEGNLMSTAAGLASCGQTVFASTFAIFATGRAFEQVRNSIAYTNLNVKVAATHGGVLIGPDGGSHQAIEDISNMRTLPNMTVVVPCDAASTYEAVEQAINLVGPVYLRFGRFPGDDVYKTGSCPFEIGKGNVLIDGNDVTLIAIGDMVPESIKAASILKQNGIDAAVIDMHTVKPIDAPLIIEYAAKTGAVVTAEDHNIIGGLGSAVAEVLAENCTARLGRIGVQDLFGRSGSKEELKKYYKLTAEDIAEKAMALVEYKRTRR